MRLSLSLLSLVCVFVLVKAEEPLPKLSPEVVSEIQRLAITLRLTDFPLTQQEYREHLALPPFAFGLGIGGKGIRSHHVCKLTDPNDPLGYYGFNIYWGERQAEPPHYPLVAKIELFFAPGNLGKYPPVAPFVLYDTDFNPEALAALKEKLRASKKSPGEFVKEFYRKN